MNFTEKALFSWFLKLWKAITAKKSSESEHKYIFSESPNCFLYIGTEKYIKKDEHSTILQGFEVMKVRKWAIVHRSNDLEMVAIPMFCDTKDSNKIIVIVAPSLV